MSKVALVTGASSGIGEETARLLHEAGFTTYAVARRVDRMAGLADAGVHTFAMDVTDDASMTAGVQRVLDEQGRVDVLVNNAGYGSYGAVEDVPIDEARRQFEVNVFGLARLTQLVTPTMREQGSGRIINVSSIGGKFYEPLGAWYHATKFAVEGFSDSLRLELAPFGIQVVIIEPGPIITEWNTISRDSLTEVSRGGAYEERAGRVRKTIERGDTGWAGTQPVVVARKIVKAATTAHPRVRYPVGRGAGSIVIARRLLPDRAFDAMINSMYRLERAQPGPHELREAKPPSALQQRGDPSRRATGSAEHLPPTQAHGVEPVDGCVEVAVEVGVAGVGRVVEQAAVQLHDPAVRRVLNVSIDARARVRAALANSARQPVGPLDAHQVPVFEHRAGAFGDVVQHVREPGASRDPLARVKSCDQPEGGGPAKLDDIGKQRDGVDLGGRG